MIFNYKVQKQAVFAFQLEIATRVMIKRGHCLIFMFLINDKDLFQVTQSLERNIIRESR